MPDSQYAHDDTGYNGDGSREPSGISTESLSRSLSNVTPTRRARHLQADDYDRSSARSARNETGKTGFHAPQIHEKVTKRLDVALLVSTSPRIPTATFENQRIVRPLQQMFLRPNLSTEATTKRMIASCTALVMTVAWNGSSSPAML
jgi:hypothetical protein